jgi:hypothetical protein
VEHSNVVAAALARKVHAAPAGRQAGAHVDEAPVAVDLLVHALASRPPLLAHERALLLKVLDERLQRLLERRELAVRLLDIARLPCAARDIALFELDLDVELLQPMRRSS